MRTAEHKYLSMFENLGFALCMWFLTNKPEAITLPKHLHWMTVSESDTTCQRSPESGHSRMMIKQPPDWLLFWASLSLMQCGMLSEVPTNLLLPSYCTSLFSTHRPLSVPQAMSFCHHTKPYVALSDKGWEDAKNPEVSLSETTGQGTFLCPMGSHQHLYFISALHQVHTNASITNIFYQNSDTTQFEHGHGKICW